MGKEDRARAEEIADALTLAGDGWREILDRVPEYDRERTARVQKLIDRGLARDDGAFLADGTLLVRDREDGRWAARHPGDRPPATLASLVRGIRDLVAGERAAGNPYPVRTVIGQLAAAIAVPVRRR